MSVPSALYMHDEAAAFAHIEDMLWTDCPVCPHCGVVDRAYRLELEFPLDGTSHRRVACCVALGRMGSDGLSSRRSVSVNFANSRPAPAPCASSCFVRRYQKSRICWVAVNPQIPTPADCPVFWDHFMELVAGVGFEPTTFRL
uniref:transposase n=1 Tax=Jannaschia marina TaxID=2741674 RepID=UPI0038B39AF9